MANQFPHFALPGTKEPSQVSGLHLTELQACRFNPMTADSIIHFK